MTGLTETGRLALIGAGKMGTALVEGFVRQGLDSKQVVAIDPEPSSATQARLDQLGVRCETNLDRVTGLNPETVLLAIKPQIFTSAAADIARLASAETLFVSVLAGVTLKTLTNALPAGQPIVRAMPNTPASIGAGMTVCIGNDHAADDHRQRVNALFKGAGSVAWIEDETDMDAVTAVSGSGPAYVFHLVEALTQAGVAQGLERALAEQLARETVAGSGRLLQETGQSAEALRTTVTSPGGTTEAALKVLMHEDGLTALMTRAVEAAKRRSKALAEETNA